MKWTDPAAALAIGIWVLVGAMLLTGHAVPDQVWAAVLLVNGAFYGIHGAQAGTGQILSSLNGSASRALTGTMPPSRSTDQATPPAASTSAAAAAGPSDPTAPPA